jgi:deazaflavin-dependent oxidoreductase (nitroreductase family)
MREPTAGTAGAPTRADAPKMPWYIPAFSPLLVRLLRAGVPLGFNGLITIRGRKSGQPRTAGVAIIQREGRRFVWAPFGEVNWVRNLRAAGEATITYRRTEETGTGDRARPGAAPVLLPRHPRAARPVVPRRHDVHPRHGQDRSREARGSRPGARGLRAAPALVTSAVPSRTMNGPQSAQDRTPSGTMSRRNRVAGPTGTVHGMASPAAVA